MTIHDRDRRRIRERLLEEGFAHGDILSLKKTAGEAERAFPILLELYAELESLLAKGNLVWGLDDSRCLPATWFLTELKSLRSEIERDPDSSDRVGGVPKAATSSGANHLGWKLADILADRAGTSEFDDIVEIVQDPGYGKARQMLPFALARVPSRRDEAVRALVEVIDDPDISAHVLEALGKLKAVEAREEIERFVDSSVPLVRRTARKVLRKLDKLKRSQPSGEPTGFQRPDLEVLELPADPSATSTNFDLEQVAPFLTRVAERFEGLEATDVDRLVTDLEDMEPDAEKVFDFAITFQGERQPLRIRVYMSDEGAPDIEFASSPAVVASIEELIDDEMTGGPTMDHKIRVMLTLTGTIADPEEVSAHLGIAPDETWRAGDPIASTIRRHRNNGWQISSGRQTHASLEEHIASLRARVGGTASSIGALASCWEIELSCRIQVIGASAPEMHFSAETVQWLSDLHATIDIDLYCLGE